MDLLFKNEVFNEGRNVTVRRGIKWSLEDEAYIPALDVDVDIRTSVMRFKDIQINTAVIHDEHDPECRDYYGLLEVMQRTYPGFIPDEIVTVVEFFV